jgi:hypothetical protein
MKPEMGTKPRVYYKDIPRKFVAGTVHDIGTYLLKIEAKGFIARP